jgi:hypothetical protein
MPAQVCSLVCSGMLLSGPSPALLSDLEMGHGSVTITHTWPQIRYMCVVMRRSRVAVATCVHAKRAPTFT